jgi:hypothetical protein
MMPDRKAEMASLISKLPHSDWYRRIPEKASATSRSREAPSAWDGVFTIQFLRLCEP